MGDGTDKDQTHQATISAPAGPDALQDQRQKLLAEQAKRVAWILRHGDEYRARLLRNIKERLPALEKLLAGLELENASEDTVYRFYHASYKLYGFQYGTGLIVDALRELLPDLPLNRRFSQIIAAGTGHKFEDRNDDSWFTTERAILEAFFHAHFFLKMVCKYGREFDEPPNAMPSGWAAVLYLYNLR